MLKKDQFYKDILDGLSLFYKSDFIMDIRNTAIQFPASGLGNSLNRRQTTSKLWLLDKLHDAWGSDLGVVHLLGGWYGVLAALIRNDARFTYDRIVNIDIDPDCERIANSLNVADVPSGRFVSVTADLYDLDYSGAEVVVGRHNGHPPKVLPKPDLLVNTSCEHLHDFGGWFDRLPTGQLMILQSNNYVAEAEHINCVADLDAFRAQAPMRELLYAGELVLDKYTRFMLIGRK